VSGWPYPAIDPESNQILAFFGRKGSGKSAAAREHFRSWPATDRLVIDINGDADPGDDLQAIPLRGPLVQLPDRKDSRTPETYRWIADPKAASFREDIDKAIGSALFPRHRKVLIWIDEGGEAFPVNQTGPNGRLLLHQSRHFQTSALICAPRPKGLDPLSYGQADRVILFDVPAPADRQRLAETVGISAAKLTTVMDETNRRGDHWSTMFEAREHRLYRLPPFELTGETA
jgi:hypothetical protein